MTAGGGRAELSLGESSRAKGAHGAGARLLLRQRHGTGDGGDRARWTKSSTARLEEGGNGVLLGLPVHITAHIRRRDVVWQARRPAML
jgi:hypothetical protein